MGEPRPWWIVVGGRRRLGRALTEDLARDHGVVVTSSRPWDAESGWVETLSTRTPVRTLRWDAADSALVPTMMADLSQLRAEGIRFSGALIVAGSFPDQPFGSWEAEALSQTWQLNLTFPLLAAQALAPHLAEGGSLQFLLDAALHRPLPRRLPYSGAKAALAALVPGLARALAPRVRVVGHALGVALPDEGSDPATLAARTLVGRTSSPEELARAIRFAAASPSLTGEVLTLDGGWRWA